MFGCGGSGSPQPFQMGAVSRGRTSCHAKVALTNITRSEVLCIFCVLERFRSVLPGGARSLSCFTRHRSEPEKLRSPHWLGQEPRQNGFILEWILRSVRFGRDTVARSERPVGAVLSDFAEDFAISFEKTSLKLTTALKLKNGRRWVRLWGPRTPTPKLE